MLGTAVTHHFPVTQFHTLMQQLLLVALRGGIVWWHGVVAPYGGIVWWHGVVAPCDGMAWRHSVVA